jgi:hypothetical protein
MVRSLRMSRRGTVANAQALQRRERTRPPAIAFLEETSNTIPGVRLPPARQARISRPRPCPRITHCECEGGGGTRGSWRAAAGRRAAGGGSHLDVEVSRGCGRHELDKDGASLGGIRLRHACAAATRAEWAGAEAGGGTLKRDKRRAGSRACARVVVCGPQQCSLSKYLLFCSAPAGIVRLGLCVVSRHY